jgi:hypothetical protein
MKKLDPRALNKFIEAVAKGDIQAASDRVFGEMLNAELEQNRLPKIDPTAMQDLYAVVSRGVTLVGAAQAVTALTQTSGLQAMMLADPKITQSVLDEWAKQWGLNIPTAEKEIPVHATITTLITREALGSMMKAVGTDSLGDPLFSSTIILSSAEKDMKGYKELVGFIKDMNKKFPGQIQLSPVTTNPVNAAVRDANSALRSDSAKVVLSPDVTEASQINQKATKKVMPVAYVSTGVLDLDKLIVAVLAQAARAENPTSYIQDKLKNMVRIENGVVVPIVTAILAEFQRQLEEARVQAAAA